MQHFSCGKVKIIMDGSTITHLYFTESEIGGGGENQAKLMTQ
jgi:hypothetical protein